MDRGNNGLRSKWGERFTKATLVQVALATGLTAYLLYQGVFGVPAASRIVAGGGAGMWLTVGYFAYIIMGVLATMAVALFFRHLELDIKRRFNKWTNGLAWLTLVMWNVGVIGGTWLMMYAGYAGGAAAMPTASGGLGYNAGQVHSLIMVSYPTPIAIFLAVAVFGAFLGLLDAALVWLRPAKVEAPVEASVGQ
jgi:hypothetical protein